ncbi:E1-like protein-activating [Ramicandelaber brevisporus]|nr:E1-like protein-activating [Ramicandelaber brevisporus]
MTDNSHQQQQHQQQQQQEERILPFVPFASAVDAQFWLALADRKLHDLRLDDSPQPLQAFYSTATATAAAAASSSHQQPPRLELTEAGLDTKGSVPSGSISIPGTLHNANTLDAFKAWDKNAMFARAADRIRADIASGAAARDPSLLSRFMLLTFADLKKYRFVHWFAFPALAVNPPPSIASDPAEASTVFDSETLMSIRSALKTQFEKIQLAFWVHNSTGAVHTLSSADVTKCSDADAASQWTLGFVDPSSHPSAPGWPLRNILAWLRSTRPSLRHIRILCLRDIHKRDISLPERSIVLTATLPETSWTSASLPSIVGWEYSDKKTLAPRIVDLSGLMNPETLASSALSLNLHLMRWRQAPHLPLERIMSSSALLIGAGTLGSYVARVLLAWGITSITFIDSARVSHSNPARQPLYTFEDAKNSEPKAVRAAKRMAEIYPGCKDNVRGFAMAVPMPGHPALTKEQLADAGKATGQLDELVKEHDMVFLLTDSRESRWLPTVLGAKYGKIVITAAMGFESFVAMRHGINHAASEDGEEHTKTEDSQRKSEKLGCYFCNDVVAPANSSVDRTLDQMCTVTRPGLAPITAATAAELAIMSIVEEEQSQTTAASTSTLPHQVRGYLGDFRLDTITGQAFSHCTACSQFILDAYEKDGFAFIKRVMENELELEQISGLAELKKQTDDIIMESVEDGFEAFDIDDSDDDDDDM